MNGESSIYTSSFLLSCLKDSQNLVGKKKVYTFIHKQKMHGHHHENNNINSYIYQNEFCVKGCSEEKELISGQFILPRRQKIRCVFDR
jgi:hypothetical protein